MPARIRSNRSGGRRPLARKRCKTSWISAPPGIKHAEQATGVGSAFMSVPPSEALKTIFSPHDYRVALQWWLGLTIMDLEDGAICPGCKAQLDEFGDHLLCCKHNNFCTRHAEIQDCLFDAVLESNQSASKEQRIPGSSEHLRPADIKLDHWEGKHVALDLTISHGWQASERLRSTANIAVKRERWRAFLRKQEAAKHAKYDKPCVLPAGLPATFGTYR